MYDKDGFNKKLVIYCYELYNESWHPDKEYDFIAPGIKKENKLNF